MINEIVNYLPWCDIKETCHICKLWMNIGQKQKIVIKNCIRDRTPSNIHDETRKRGELRIGKSHFVNQSYDKIIEKFGKIFSLSKVTSENLGIRLTNQAYENSVVENIFKKKFKHGLLHSLTHKFTEHISQKKKVCDKKGKTGIRIKFTECSETIPLDEHDVSLEKLEFASNSLSERQIAIPYESEFFKLFLKCL